MSETAFLTPRENPDLIGHEAAEATLLEALASGRLAHAWMITGPKGVGKATLAHRFARHILAHGNVSGGSGSEGDDGPGLFGEELPATSAETKTNETLHMAPDHPVFRRAASGGHADLLVIERAVDEKSGRLRSEIRVDDVRGVQGFLSLTSGEGGWRVVVIDSADEMNRNAANAVLKILEEPPRNALIQLVCHNPGRLLPTIRSRCRQLSLRPLAAERVAALLTSRLPELPAADAALIARLADGSIGRALTLAEEGGIEIYREMAGLLEKAPEIPVDALHAFAGRLAQAGREAEFEMAAELYRGWLERLVIVAGTGTGTGADTSSGGQSAGKAAGEAAREAAPEAAGEDERAVMARLAAAASLDRWLEVWEKATRLMDRARAVNLDRKQVILNLFLALGQAAR